MQIFEYLQDLLFKRGFFASFLVITGWGYTIILICVLVFYSFVYIYKALTHTDRS